uniref:Uncharacterized protein n=1 Tax=Cacopsylla melanoneura TaxID=428564 RepID=A0A8D8SXL5_9HEMI
MMRALLLLSLLICCITSINTDDTLDTTVKKRRGRPKKVNTEPGAVKVTTRPIVISSGEKEKVTSRQEVTTTPPGVTNPGGSHSSVVLSATKTTFDEYETWFDSSGFWNPPNKLRPNVSTKKRRKFKTTIIVQSTTESDILDDDDGVTGNLEGLYYSLKGYYGKPENQKELDRKAKNIIKKFDQDKGLTHYTWVSIEDKALGKMSHDKLKDYPELDDLSAMPT